MSYGSSSFASGSRTPRRVFEFGRTYVVRPKGRHQATILWLHGLGDNGSSWSQLLETLPLPNIKWICPTAPTRPIAAFGGFPCTAWSDVGDPSEDGPDDVEGLEASATHVANLLSTEPADIKLGIGGFSMGAATALYSATCFAQGRYGNGIPFPINISAVVALSGWLPCSRSLKNKLEGSREAARRAASLPTLMCHGRGILTCILYNPSPPSEIAILPPPKLPVGKSANNPLIRSLVPSELSACVLLPCLIPVLFFPHSTRYLIPSCTVFVLRFYNLFSTFPWLLPRLLVMFQSPVRDQSCIKKLQLCSHASRFGEPRFHRTKIEISFSLVAGDEVVTYKHGEKSAEAMTSAGFRNLTFRAYSGLGHYTVPQEMYDVCKWLTASLGLDGYRA